MNRESSAASLPPRGTAPEISPIHHVIYINGIRFEFENGGKDQSVSENDWDVVTLQRDSDEEEGEERFRLCPDDKEKTEKNPVRHNRLFKKQSIHRRNTKKKRFKPFKCRLCRKRFSFQNTLILHLQSHSAGKPFLCPTCGLTFYLMRCLQSHMATHSGDASTASDPNEPFPCRECGRRFPCLQKLKEHSAFHSDLNLYRCSRCHKVFPTSQGLKNHLRVHTGEKPFPCLLCGKGFKQKSALNVHAATHSGERPHLCFICGKSYCRADVLKVHLRVHTGERPYQCHECQKSFYYRQGLIVHQKTHKPKPTGPCRQRGRPRGPLQGGPRRSRRTRKVSEAAGTGSETILQRKKLEKVTQSDEHTVSTQGHDHHAAPQESVDKQSSFEQEKNPSVQPEQQQGAPRTKKKYDCPTCGKLFPHNSALRRHLVVHSGKRPFKCFLCGRGFTQGGNLKTHMKVHKGELKVWSLVQEPPSKEAPPTVLHLCEVCGMEFPHKQQLDEHKETHKKPFACPDCAKTFKSEYYFRMHLRCHADGPTFFCPDCGKCCISAVSLRKHKMTHTGEKNYRCEQCGRAFLQSSHLSVHLKTHSGERPHLCSVCGKSYSKARTLKVHLRVHTGEKPYTCDTCGKRFYYDQGYRKHRKIHDKKPKTATKPLGRPKRQLAAVNND